MVRHHARKTLAHQVTTCPFCPGNETLTAAEVLRVPASANIPWHVRVVPNKFAVSREPSRRPRKMARCPLVNGFGAHDVIIETPDFNFTIRSVPAESDGVKCFHWYLSIIPRLTRGAGLELGVGDVHQHGLARRGGGVFAQGGCVESVQAAGAGA